MGSTNPLALDIIASNVAGYETMSIPTSKIGLARKTWLSSEDDIAYDGPERASLVVKNFRKIPVSGIKNIALQFVLKRVKPLRKIERRPVFLHDRCTGCQKCVRICPVGAIHPRHDNKKHIVLTDGKCIRCYCCSEVCGDDAIEIRRKLFGV
jgi:ferredoxin